VAPLLEAFAVPLERQPLHLHDAIRALWIGRRTSDLIELTTQQGMNAAIVLDHGVRTRMSAATESSGIMPAPLAEPFGRSTRRCEQFQAVVRH
jgi:hypothetical protein